jgi:isopenicillin-N N-acyltransferase-like protein
MSSVNIPVVMLQGTPFDRGRQHGQRFSREIAYAIAAARTQHGTPAYEAARREASAAFPAIEGRAPDVAAELQGIAEGSRCDPLEILLRSGFEFFAAAPMSGCSAIAVATPQGALVAQNWDAPPAVASELTLFLHFGSEGFEQAIIASHGGLGWVGCNRHGLAFVNNDLMMASNASGLPSQIVRRLILGERSVAAALAQMKALPHMAGRSYLLGDASGAVAGVEVAARAGARINQSLNPVLHTNHALDPDIARRLTRRACIVMMSSSAGFRPIPIWQRSQRCWPMKKAIPTRFPRPHRRSSPPPPCSRSFSNAARIRSTCVQVRPRIMPISGSHGNAAHRYTPANL